MSDSGFSLSGMSNVTAPTSTYIDSGDPGSQKGTTLGTAFQLASMIGGSIAYPGIGTAIGSAVGSAGKMALQSTLNESPTAGSSSKSQNTPLPMITDMAGSDSPYASGSGIHGAKSNIVVDSTKSSGTNLAGGALDMAKSLQELGQKTGAWEKIKNALFPEKAADTTGMMKGLNWDTIDMGMKDYLTDAATYLQNYSPYGEAVSSGFGNIDWIGAGNALAEYGGAWGDIANYGSSAASDVGTSLGSSAASDIASWFQMGA